MNAATMNGTGGTPKPSGVSSPNPSPTYRSSIPTPTHPRLAGHNSTRTRLEEASAVLAAEETIQEKAEETRRAESQRQDHAQALETTLRQCDGAWRPAIKNWPGGWQQRSNFDARVRIGEIQVSQDGKQYRVRTFEQYDQFRRAREEQQRQEADRAHVTQQRRQSEEKLRAAQKLWEEAGVPPRYFDADLNQLGNVPREYVRVAAELRDLLERPGMTALVGPRGPGKTHLACALVREFCRHGRAARYLRTLELFRRIRATWGAKRGEATEDDLIDELRGVDLLVLDEIQIRSDSPWENMILTDLLDARYADNLSTLLVGNLEPKALQASLGESVSSRLSETGRVLICLWPSLRTTGKARVPGQIRVDQFPPVTDGAKPTHALIAQRR